MIRPALLFLAYFFTAKFGLAMDAVGGFATLVWPPTGIALAFLVLFGWRLWPAVLAAAFLVNHLQGASPWVAAGIGAGNTLEALAGAYLLRGAGFRASLDRLPDVLALVLAAALGSTLISATAGVGSLVLGGVVQPSAFGSIWMAWWLGDVLGDLVVAPVIMTAGAWRRIRPTRRRGIESLALSLITVLVSLYVFTDAITGRAKHYEWAFLVFPLAIWTAIRFDAAATAVMTFSVAAISIWGAAKGGGPFQRETLSASLALLQTFTASVAVTALILNAVASERRLTERRSMGYARQIEAANRDLGMMLNVIVHDLKEPFRSIENFSEMVDEKYADRLDDQGRDYLRRVVRASGRMRRLLDDILRLSRVRQAEIRKEPVEGQALVKEAMEWLEGPIREERARIDVQPDLPVFGVDRTMAVQAVYNLISNALKFTCDGQSPRIEICAYAGPEGKGLVVRDQGPGVPPELSDRIFRLFERGVGRDIEGTGAGLAIVYQVAERHDGKAWVRPRSGGGSEFVITFESAEKPHGIS